MKTPVSWLVALAAAALLCHPGVADANDWYSWLTYYLGNSAPQFNYQPQDSYQTYSQWTGTPYGVQYGFDYQNYQAQYYVQNVPGYGQQATQSYGAPSRVYQHQYPAYQRSYAAPHQQYSTYQSSGAAPAQAGYRSGRYAAQYPRGSYQPEAYPQQWNGTASWRGRQSYRYGNQTYAMGNTGGANCLPGSS